jgi:DNA-binding MarR family transcriptional regulator
MEASRTSTKAERSASKPAALSAAAPGVLYRTPGYLARRFQQVCVAIISESLAKDGSQQQFAVLSGLEHLPGTDQRSLAEALSIVPVNLGQIIDQLEQMGLAERRINGADRRARALHPTARGRQLHRRLLPGNRATNARILEPLAPRERELLIDLLARVIEGNAAYAIPGAGRRKRGSRQPASKKANDQHKG